MENQEFLEEFSDIFELEGPSQVTNDFKLNVSEWESLQVVSTIAVIDEYFDVTVDPDDFQKFETFKDLMSFVESQK